MAIISLGDSWYLHGGLNLTLYLDISHFVIHKYKLMVIRNTPRAGKRNTAKSIISFFSAIKKLSHEP